jgi:hypothetical protein
MMRDWIISFRAAADRLDAVCSDIADGIDNAWWWLP